MYISANIADRIKMLAKSKNKPMKQILCDAGVGSNTMANLKTSMPKSDTLARIADVLDCSVDYLLGRSEFAETVTIENYELLNDSAKAIVAEYIRIMASDNKYRKTPTCANLSNTVNIAAPGSTSFHTANTGSIGRGTIHGEVAAFGGAENHAPPEEIKPEITTPQK